MQRRRLLSLVLATAALSAAAVTLAPPAQAVATRSFDIDDAAAFALGELHHAAVRSDGEVSASVGLERLALPPEVGLVLSAARASDGTLYLGTDDAGRIYRVSGERVEVFAETQQLLVSSMVLGDGILYAGTLPEGRIFAVDTGGAGAGQAHELVRPGASATTGDPAIPAPVPAPTDGASPPPPLPLETPAESIWDLAWDASRHRLYAATGPHGQVFAIDPRGRANLYWDAPAAHVMSLALAPDGTLYAGTSDDAVVARITAPGRAEIAWDFPGNEVTALAFRDGVLVAAANEFADPPAVSAAATKRSATASRAARPRPGKGRVWTLGADGRAERVWAQEEGHVTRLEVADGGVIFAAIGHEGRVVRIEPDRTSSVWIDVDERQVLAIGLTSSAPFLVTGDGAALYRVRAERADAPSWTSKVLDAELLSRWGQLVWRGRGAIRIETRSGNTERPDETWSAWSTPMTSAGPVRSPAARFLQVRAGFAGDDAVLRALSVYYLPQNQRPVLTEVGLKARTTKRAPDVDPTAPPAPSASLGLTWKVENVDGDRLRYRLRFREETQAVWREILRDSELLSATEYAWNTTSVPDGWYVVEVEATDELSNPDAYVLRSRASSEPILVDNTPPEVVDLSASGVRLSGRARDGMGPISRIEIAIDGGEFRPIFPEDDLLDTREEPFSIDATTLSGLLRPLEPGSHIAAVRAFDAAGNHGQAEVGFTMPRSPAPSAPPARRPR
jgi:outer membrane protein assembly factor BamB